MNFILRFVLLILSKKKRIFQLDQFNSRLFHFQYDDCWWKSAACFFMSRYADWRLLSHCSVFSKIYCKIMGECFSVEPNRIRYWSIFSHSLDLNKSEQTQCLAWVQSRIFDDFVVVAVLVAVATVAACVIVVRSSNLSQRCLQNSESEGHCQCDSAGGSKVLATGILHSDCWCLSCFYFVSFYRFDLWKFIILYLVQVQQVKMLAYKALAF